MNILLAVDGSEASLGATHFLIDFSGQFAHPPNIVLVNVDPPLPNRIRMGPNQRAAYHAANAEAMTRAARRALVRAEVDFEEALLVGDIALTILRTAKRRRADLIIMGAKNRGSLGALLLGSIASKVVANSSIPVTLAGFEMG